MPTITSNATGNASAGGTWVGGVAPVLGDKVIVDAAHTVTLDTTGIEWGDDTATAVTVNGVLKFSRVASSDLRVRGQLVIGSAGTFDMGKTGDLIPSTYKATLLLNDSAALADGKWGLVVTDLGSKVYFGGAARSRNSNLTVQANAAATSITVDDVTGWENGDTLVLECTTSASNEQEIRTITGAITGTGPYTVPVGALTFIHHTKWPQAPGRWVDSGKVGNLNSNVTVRAFNASFHAYVDLGPNFSGSDAVDRLQVQGVSFWYCGTTTVPGLMLGRSAVPGRLSVFQNIAFYQFKSSGVYFNLLTDYQRPCDDLAFYTSVQTTGEPPLAYGATSILLVRRAVFYKHGVTQTGCIGQSDNSAFHVAEDCVFGAVESGAHHFWSRYAVSGACIERRCRHMTCPTAIYGINAAMRLETYETDFCLKAADGGIGNPQGARLISYPYGATVATEQLHSDARYSAFSVEFEPLPTGTLSGKSPNSFVSCANLQRDPLTNTRRTPRGSLLRDNVNAYDPAGSCLRFEPVTGFGLFYNTQIPAPDNTSVLVAGFVQRSDASVTVTITLSGLGINPVVVTLSGATGVGTWQQWSAAAIQTTGADSLLNVGLTVSGTTGESALLDQIVAPPTKAIETGALSLWYNGLPANLVVANFVSALDIWNMQTADLTLAGSVGKRVVDNIDAAITSRLSAAGYTAPPTAVAIRTEIDANSVRLALVERLLRNRTVTDPVAGTITVYADDDVTVLLTAPLWEDAGGTIGYRGQGAERRDRLT